jgi:predicted phage terminase large subunit-like protein
MRGQWSAGARNRVIRQTAELDRQRYGRVLIYLEREGGSGGKESGEISIKDLAGFPVRAESPTGSKEVRAEPLAAQAEAGNVLLVRGPWNACFLEELCIFPAGKHDDQVDSASGAFNKLVLAPARKLVVGA